jgi:sulfonate transport system permease protein
VEHGVVRLRDLRGIAVPLTLVAAWFVLAGTGRWDQHLLVPPRQFAAALGASLENRDFWTAAGASLLRLAIGWSIGTCAGVALGLTVGCSTLAQRLAGPSFNGVRQVALFAWIPLLTAWFGDGDAAMIVLIALAAFFPAALNTEAGCRATPAALLEVGRVFEFDRWTVLRRIVLPSARPSIVAGLQIALTTSWIGTIGAEYLIDQGTGLGIFIESARMENRLDLVLVCIVTLGLAGYVLNTLLGSAFADGRRYAVANE